METHGAESSAMMMVNWFGVAAVLLGFGWYFVGVLIARKPLSGVVTVFWILVTVALAIPAFLYAAYYSKLLGEPIWLYRVRVVPGSELLASFAGLLAGWMQVRVAPQMKLSAIGKRILVPVVLGFTLAMPHLKPWLRPLRTSQLHEEWKADVCMQSTLSTCGPASAATIVRQLDGRVTERDLANEALTCRSGTEDWYLARALHRRGFSTAFLLSTPSDALLPAIAGVRLRSLGNSGHFIALLERRGDAFVVADPMEGLSTNSLANLEEVYEFTGFFMPIGRSANR